MIKLNSQYIGGLLDNQYLDNLIELTDERFSIEALNMSTSEWVCKNTTLRDRPFSYEGYEFQQKILDDWHPNMDVIKISQVGITEIMIRKVLSFVVRQKGSSAIYSLPTEDMFTRVSDTRVRPIVTKDKVFNTASDKENRSVRSKGTMQFGRSFLYTVPATETSATSIPADIVINDEVDLCDQQMLTLFGSRMQNSQYKIHQRFSTPTFPSFGIDLNWGTSDQHFYMCKCEKCGHWQHPEFNSSFVQLVGDRLPDTDNLFKITQDFSEVLDLSASYVCCEKCRARLPLGDKDYRTWVSKFPSRRDSRGYRIGPFSTDRLDLRYIFMSLWGYQKTEFLRGFHNTVLGLPYSDGNMQIPQEDIEACMTGVTDPPCIMLDDKLWVGVDMGKICHVTIGRGDCPEKLEIISVYEKHVEDIVQHLEELCAKPQVIGGTVDRHPYEPTSREIFKATKGKIIPVEYRGSKDMNLVKNEFNELSHAQVNNTWFLDNFATLIRKRSLRISGYGHKKSVLIQHYRDMVRDEKPNEPARWQKLTGQDHYLHSGAFMALSIHLHDVIRFNAPETPNTMVYSYVTSLREDVDNLIGVSNKRLAVL